MALSFGTRIKFLLGHIWLSISSKVIRGPSLLVLPSLVSILLPMVFNKSVFAPTRASLGVYTNFKCSDCGKCFTRRATLEHHQQHFPLSQQGVGLKRAVEEEKEKEVKQARWDLPKKIDEKVTAEPDEEESMLEGNKVNAYFYRKTKSQKRDQKVFFKESAPRLETRLKEALKEKKAIKWSLVYHWDVHAG